jgi:hypothetical protein
MEFCDRVKVNEKVGSRWCRRCGEGCTVQECYIGRLEIPSLDSLITESFHITVTFTSLEKPLSSRGVICGPPPPPPGRICGPPPCKKSKAVSRSSVLRVILYGTRCYGWFRPRRRCILDLAVAIILTLPSLYFRPPYCYIYLKYGC